MKYEYGDDGGWIGAAETTTPTDENDAGGQGRCWRTTLVESGENDNERWVKRLVGRD